MTLVEHLERTLGVGWGIAHPRAKPRKIAKPVSLTTYHEAVRAWARQHPIEAGNYCLDGRLPPDIRQELEDAARQELVAALAEAARKLK